VRNRPAAVCKASIGAVGESPRVSRAAYARTCRPGARSPLTMRLVALSVRGIQVPALSQLASTHAHETLLWASKHKGARHTFNYDLINSGDPTSQLSSLWHIPSVPLREKSLCRHPTQKPLRLLRRAVLSSTRGGELIFDPFCGSGTPGLRLKNSTVSLWERRRSGSTPRWRDAGSELRRGDHAGGDPGHRRREHARWSAGHRRGATLGWDRHATWRERLNEIRLHTLLGGGRGSRPREA
jgi:hypothetical protein